MNDVLSTLKALNRPRLLVSAARHGLNDYRRENYLRRIIKTQTLPRHSEIVMRLLEIERELEDARTQKIARYNALRHIEVLMALMSEARHVALRSVAGQDAAVTSPDLLRAI